ncbi:MAG TPA: 1,4-dihydroxy-2-naphthoate octaprenyltransferase [Candidatus Omnitrophota bacterium]|nr:1,4-dihydroxy-2-naphthoate octaprenyltransferase [Candidatus Omnitrophota bacterium]
MPVQIRKLISRSPILWVRAWLRVLGPPFIALTLVVSLLGGTITFQRTGVINLLCWFLSALGLVSIHFGTSCLNDYFDFLSGTDNINLTPTTLSGGSRVIQEGTLSPRALLIAGSLFISLGAIIGLYLTYLKGPLILALGVIGVFLAVGYVHPNVNLSKRGLGELAVGISFGPIMLSGVYYAQTKTVDLSIILIGIVLGLLAATVLWINEIPDYEADKTTGKNNWVVRVGKKKASLIYIVLLSLVYLLSAVLIYKNILPRFSWVVFLTLPLALKAGKIALRNYNDVERLLPANALTIALTISFGVILSLAFFMR